MKTSKTLLVVFGIMRSMNILLGTETSGLTAQSKGAICRDKMREIGASQTNAIKSGNTNTPETKESPIQVRYASSRFVGNVLQALGNGCDCHSTAAACIVSSRACVNLDSSAAIVAEPDPVGNNELDSSEPGAIESGGPVLGETRPGISKRNQTRNQTV